MLNDLRAENGILAYGLPESFEVATTPLTRPAPRRALVALWFVFAAQLIAMAIAVPPWQNPDEPVHFAVIRALTRNAWLDITHRRNVDAQSEILQSMAAHDWWRAYQEPVPTPFPRTFLDVPTHLGDAATAPPLYYVAMAAYCRALRTFGVESQYYVVRLASVVMTLLTFAVILRGAREWFGDEVALFTGVLIALVPQFALIGISVSPDPFLFLVASFVWWQGARLTAHRRAALPLVLMILAALAAVLAKQLAVPLLLQIPVLVMVAALATRHGRIAVAVSLAVVIVLRLVGILHAVTFLSPEQLTSLHRYKLLFGWRGFASTPAYFADFSWRLFESAYVVAGWQRFYASHWIVAAAMVLFALLLSTGVWHGARHRDVRVRMATLAAIGFAAVQLAAIYGTNYYLPRWGAQGRFLFPAIGPFAVLCAVALAEWRSRRVAARLCVGAVAALGLLDLLSWLTVLIPVYARWI